MQNNDELWECDWQTASAGVYANFNISKSKVVGIEPSQPQVSKQAYRPPGARGKQSTFKLHDDEEAPQNKNSDNTNNTNLSRSQIRNRKRKEAKNKAKNENETETSNGTNNSTEAPQHFVEDNNYQGAKGILTDPEKEKKMRKLKDKIAGIQKIKQAQAEGKQLEKNQLEKLSKEQELLDELKALNLS